MNDPEALAIIEAARPAARRSRQARVAWGDHVVTVGGDGLQPNVVPDARMLGWKQDFADEWARYVEQRFRDWSNDPRACDSAGKLRFGALHVHDDRLAHRTRRRSRRRQIVDDVL